jgi:hypothetical protein
VVLPAWAPALHTPTAVAHGLNTEQCSELARRMQAVCSVDEPLPEASVAVLALPSADSAGTTLVALDLQPPAAEGLYPYMHDEVGLSSISGKFDVRCALCVCYVKCLVRTIPLLPRCNAGKDVDRWSGISRSNMRRGSEISTTLPGHIVSAEPGSHEVVVSHDLQAYLCAEVALQTAYSKCSDVRFDWTFPHGALEAPADPEELAVTGPGGVPYSHTCSDNTVAQISPHRIVLQRPYVGPMVLHGQPRVLLRAALVPCGRTANANATAVTSSSRLASRGVRGVYGSTTVPEQYTALCAHPTYPFLVAGTRSDKVVIVNPTYNHQQSGESSYSSVNPMSTDEATELARLAAEEVSAIAALRGPQWWRRVLPVREGGAAGCAAPSLANDVPERGALEVGEPASESDADVAAVGDRSGVEVPEQCDLYVNTGAWAVSEEPCVVIESSQDSVNEVCGDFEVPPQLLPLAKRSRSEPTMVDASTGGVGQTLTADGHSRMKSSASSSVPVSANATSGTLSLKASLARIGPSHGATSANFVKPALHLTTKVSDNQISFPSFRSASAPTLPAKRNLLSTLARAKENVPIPAVAVPVASKVDASSVKEVIIIDDPAEHGVLKKGVSATTAMSKFAVHGQSAVPSSSTVQPARPLSLGKPGPAKTAVKAAGSGGKSANIASFFTAVKK